MLTILHIIVLVVIFLIASRICEMVFPKQKAKSQYKSVLFDKQVRLDIEHIIRQTRKDGLNWVARYRTIREAIREAIKPSEVPQFSWGYELIRILTIATISFPMYFLWGYFLIVHGAWLQN
jgi:hypothetical protein